MKSKEYYMQKYDDLVRFAMKQADEYYATRGVPEASRDYGEWISYEEGDATTEEVVGYYLETYPDDFWDMWKENTDGIILSKQDKKVEKILFKFHRKNKRSVKGFCGMLAFLLGIGGKIRDNAVDEGLCDFSGQGRDEYGR